MNSSLLPIEKDSPISLDSAAGLRSEDGVAARSGFLIVNADDWGRDSETTDRTFECVSHGSVTSVSAMVFMEDSQRAAEIARENGVDAGLHLNFTTEFSAKGCASKLAERQGEIARRLLAHRYSQALFYPGLGRSFEYVVASQVEEFFRLYGEQPGRIDGHHHMHLCSNVLLGGLLPAGTMVRRNFSFQHGEKGFANRLYRRMVDVLLKRRHRMVDYFFSLPPLSPPERLRRIFELAGKSAVEVETHPVRSDEYRFLMGDDFRRLSEGLRLTSYRAFQIGQRQQTV